MKLNQPFTVCTRRSYLMLDPCENSYRCWGIQLPSVSWPARLFEQAAKTRSLYAAFKKLAWQKRKRYKEEVHFIQLCVIFFFNRLFCRGTRREWGLDGLQGSFDKNGVKTELYVDRVADSL